MEKLKQFILNIKYLHWCLSLQDPRKPRSTKGHFRFYVQYDTTQDLRNISTNVCLCVFSGTCCGCPSVTWILQSQLSSSHTHRELLGNFHVSVGETLSHMHCPTKSILLVTLTKVDELLHRQGRRRKLGKPLHLFGYPGHGTAFQQKLGEPHVLSPSKTPAVSVSGIKCPFFLQHAPAYRLLLADLKTGVTKETLYIWLHRSEGWLWVPHHCYSRAAFLAPC